MESRLMFRIVLLTALAAAVAAPAWADNGSVSSVNGSIHVTAQHGDVHSVNGSVTVDGSQQSTGDLSTVNGTISIDPGSHAGNVTTVNGGVHIGADATVGRIQAVNGSLFADSRTTASSMGTINGPIDLREGVRVTGPVDTVNGALNIAPGVDISGQLSNVNGRIRLEGVHIGGMVRTVSGDIYAGPHTRIDGGIFVGRRYDGWFSWFSNVTHTLPKIVIAPDAVVTGSLRFEQEVKLYVSNRAKIGPVEGATAIVFSGDSPPY